MGRKSAGNVMAVPTTPLHERAEQHVRRVDLGTLSKGCSQLPRRRLFKLVVAERH